MKNTLLVAALLPVVPALLDPTPACAAPASADGGVEEIVVTGRSTTAESARLNVDGELVVDTAAVLGRLPGSDANGNGPLTAIAQYRGMYGDRVSIRIDGLGLVGGGPNAMDPPLAYVSPMITEELVLERGIPGVASAPETIGGHIEARMNRGDFGTTTEFRLSGMAGTRFATNGDVSTSAARLTTASSRHRLSAIAELDDGNDIESPDGTILPSGFSRDRYDLSYAYAGDGTKILAYAGRLETSNAGTPALPMDIRYIETDLAGLQYRRTFADSASLHARFAYNVVDHLMDNFSLRPPPDMSMAFRQNLTGGRGTLFNVFGERPFGDYSLRVGIDGRLAEHASFISNPNNAAFYVDNFVNVERNVTGAYATLGTDTGRTDWEVGVRYNRISADTGEVGTGGMPAMMGMLADELAVRFNAADRSRSFDNTDIVLKVRQRITDTLALDVDIGSKSRAPSYQELYLWLPIQATGGLADGRSYVGSLGLESERSNEVSLGLDWTGERFAITPQVFYKNVGDYIQGVPATDDTANRLAAMMTGRGALEFANVDAEIYGVDVAWRMIVTEGIHLDGTAAWNRGRRTDVADNLYRLPPLNASAAFNLISGAFSFRGEVIAFSKQDKVSRYNDEPETPGYAILNGRVVWRPTPGLRLELELNNILDRGYRNHLTGINRVRQSDIPLGVRIPGAGRSIIGGLVAEF